MEQFQQAERFNGHTAMDGFVIGVAPPATPGFYLSACNLSLQLHAGLIMSANIISIQHFGRPTIYS